VFLTYVVAVVGPGDVESRADVDVRREVFDLDRCVAERPEEGRKGDAGRDVEEFHCGFVKLNSGRRLLRLRDNLGDLFDGYK
jgi:hypothetical protein